MKYLLLLVVSAPAVFLASCQTESTPDPFQPRFVTGEVPPVKVPEGQAYTFGYLEVPENRQRAGSDTIRLPVYIFKSRSKHPQPDPVIYTVGGPGNSSLGAAPYMNYYRYLDDRDLILFEQRGTAYAQPHLDCPEWARAAYLANLPDTDPTTADSLYREGARQCRDRLQNLGIDLNGYHTEAIAADIEDLRRTLAIESYNLLTISYSTKIAQVLMRDHPQAIRSVVMDSPLPLEVSYDEESVINLLEAFEAVFSDCRADPACRAAFPDLGDRFFHFLEQCTLEPLAIDLAVPGRCQTMNFRFQWKDLIGLFSPGDTWEITKMPARMAALLDGDYRYLEEQLRALVAGPGDGNGSGMRLSVWCAEETPFASRAKIQEEKDRYPAVRGLSPAVFEPAICDIWSVQARGERENQAIRSPIPTLLISGAYDENTPPKWAAQMKSRLANSFHLTFPGWGHTPTTYWNNPCGMAAAQAFFNDPTVRPAPECLQTLQTPVFEM